MNLCPKCRAAMRSTELDGLPAHTCEHCEGLWLAREFVELWAQRSGRPRGVDAPPLEWHGGPSYCTPAMRC